MEKYIKIEQDWYGALKGDILKWTGNNSEYGNPLMEYPKSRTSTSRLRPYASISGLDYTSATEEEWRQVQAYGNE